MQTVCMESDFLQILTQSKNLSKEESVEKECIREEDDVDEKGKE